MSVDTLINKYRPKRWEDVLGQPAVISSLKSLLASGKAQSYILAGPPGTGKTTLARIAAEAVKAEHWDIEAARYNSVDDARKIVEFVQYKPFGKNPGRAIVMDEAHRLSKAAWDVLKKPVEEPQRGVYWFFCTTEVGKFDTAIRTRCVTLNLKPVESDLLFDLVADIRDAEKFKTNDDILDVIVGEANGSPRQAITNLALVHNVKNKNEAKRLLQSAIESEGAIELCRFLTRPQSWVSAMKVVGKLKDESPESVRIVVCHYFAKVAAGATNDKAAINALRVIDSFGTPFNQTDGMAPLINAIGRVFF